MTAPQPQRRLPLWTRIVLVVSIGLNLAGAGLIIGAALSPPSQRSIPFTAFGLRHVMRHLPEQDLGPFRDTTAKVNASVRPIRQTLRTDLTQMVEILRAEEFNGAALRALFARQRTKLSEASAISADMLVSTLEGLSLDARRRFAEAILIPRTRREPGGRPRLAGDVDPPQATAPNPAPVDEVEDPDASEPAQE
ncbi:MAG: periplasmic heavy metal sensor [Pseudomonadota bacterium]